MKKLTFLLAFLPLFATAQEICTPTSNVVLYSNYDGGRLFINVDVDIPNLKIGIVSYEAVQVTFTGPFVNNISEIRYAGMNSSNSNCGQPNIPTTTFTGHPAAATISINQAPQATISDPNGNNSMICAYSCSSSTSQGGCNTEAQVFDYFFQNFNTNTVYSHTIQYQCWTESNVQNISSGGNCCPPPPPIEPLTSTASSTFSGCSTDCNGTVTVVPNGGVTPYSYEWSANANGASSATVEDLCPDTYEVTVTDAVGTQTTASVTITEIEAIAVSSNIVNPSCHGLPGSIELDITGGVSPYNVNWFGVNPSQITSGTYDVLITDANNCDLNYNFQITQPSEITATLNTIPDLGNCTGSISVVVQGGDAPYSYNWVGLDASTNNLDNLCADTYCVEVTDNNNCTREFCGTITASSVSIETETLEAASFYIGPNPSDNETILTIESPHQMEYSISVVDMLGKEIYSTSVFTNSHETKTELSVPVQGVYFILVADYKNVIKTIKWIKK